MTVNLNILAPSSNDKCMVNEKILSGFVIFEFQSFLLFSISLLKKCSSVFLQLKVLNVQFVVFAVYVLSFIFVVMFFLLPT